MWSSSCPRSKQKTEEPGVLKQFQEHAQRRKKIRKQPQQLQGKRDEEKRKTTRRDAANTSEEQRKQRKKKKRNLQTQLLKSSTSQSQSDSIDSKASLKMKEVS